MGDQYKIAHGEDIKMRDMKMSIYGDYIVSVPHFHLQMLRDIPLPDSSARFIGEINKVKGLKPHHIAGQHWVGTMIPVPVDKALGVTGKKQEEKEKKRDLYSSYIISPEKLIAEFAKKPKDLFSQFSYTCDNSTSEKEKVV